MKVLGIDPGYGIVGFGIVEKTDKGVSLVDYGVIETPKTLSLSDRLNIIFESILNIIDEYKPDEVSIEELFFFKNLSTCIPVAEARGVLICGCKQRNLSVFEYTPMQVKQALTGIGNAKKLAVENMVKQVLQIKQKIQPDDASDALAIALCHAFTIKAVKDSFGV